MIVLYEKLFYICIRNYLKIYLCNSPTDISRPALSLCVEIKIAQRCAYSLTINVLPPPTQSRCNHII